ncbi:unnamed protein product [Orchesella dallaii]|uniref:G-protein coupled receptors family 1 profile domain-containing protein n=1 Tax=Orchesella dallaii TaxID=48710 RepID=A0ABP1QSF7_9HEXA
MEIMYILILTYLRAETIYIIFAFNELSSQYILCAKRVALMIFVVWCVGMMSLLIFVFEVSNVVIWYCGRNCYSERDHLCHKASRPSCRKRANAFEKNVETNEKHVKYCVLPLLNKNSMSSTHVTHSTCAN